jgi:hypothetical protein
MSKIYKLRWWKCWRFHLFNDKIYEHQKIRHLYKQPPSTSNPFNTFCLSYKWIDCLGDYFDVIFGPLDASTLW